MNKEKVLEVINNLEDDVQAMREEGETDLRTVLNYIRNAYYEIKEME